MDKNAIIAKCAQEPEDRLLLARVWDKYEQTERRNIPSATVFLSPRERQLAQAMLNAAGVRSGYLFDGGYEGAERTVLLFLPGWAEEPEGSGLVFLRASFHGGESLTHRDILGSLMGLGVVRERVGDILVSPHSADIVAAPSLREFFLREWDQAGRVKLTVTEIGREALCVPQAQVKVIRDTVSSLRLDAVLSCGFSLARGKAADAVTGGRVSLNHRECLKADRQVAQGDVITCRGLGKCVVKEVPGQSKKGRTMLVLERYI